VTNGDNKAAKRELVELNERIRVAPEDSLLKCGLEHSQALALFYKGVLEEDDDLVRESARYFVKEGQLTYAALFLSLINDPNAEDLLERALTEPPWSLPGWEIITGFITPKQIKNPVYIKMENHLGITPEWRRYLCQRANELPLPTRITCDESQYALQ